MPEEITPTPERVNQEVTEQDVKEAKLAFDKAWNELSKIQNQLNDKYSDFMRAFHDSGDDIKKLDSETINLGKGLNVAAFNELDKAKDKYRDLVNKYFSLEAEWMKNNRL